jgi:integrase
MARTNPKQMRRDRVLSDDEIRTLWAALEASPAPYRQLVRFLLLTAQRREEAAQMRKGELLSSDLWEIPAERFKTGKPQAVPLSPFANEQLEALGQLRELGDFLFTTTGNKPFSGYSKAKRKLDAEMERLSQQSRGPSERRATLRPWRLHDLRRTGKTIMQRAGVHPHHSERVLGHAIAGVEGVYDRHAYVSEKRQALCALATQVKFILADLPTEIRRVLAEVSDAVASKQSRKVLPLKLVGARTSS